MIDLGVKLNSLHSRDDFDMTMREKQISNPPVKREKVSVPLRDGSPDLSTVLSDGDIKYDNREITINLVALDYDREKLKDLKDRLNALYHGKDVKIIFDDDMEFFYEGSASLEFNDKQRNVLECSISVDAYPFKKRIFPTVRTVEVNGSSVVTYLNMRKWVVPTFETDAEMTIIFGNSRYTISKGTQMLPNIVFKQGENVIKYEGTGTVKVTYQEGAI